MGELMIVGNKMSNKLNKRELSSGLVSAGLVFFAGIIIYFVRGRLLGEHTFMHADLAAQYSSFAKLFLKQLFGHHNIIYSWYVSMGSDTLPIYAFYSCFSPFTLIYAFDFNIDLLSFAVTFGKLALSAATFNAFVRRRIGVRSPLSIALGMSYALSGFSLAYYSNMIWFDALYILPIIIGLVINFVYGKSKAVFLVLSYAYIFVVNFYSGYNVGIFSAIVFLALLIKNEKLSIKSKIKKIIVFVVVALSAGCLSMPVLYPTAKAFLGGRVSDSSAFLGLHLNVFDLYNQLFIGQASSREFGHFPYIYCGLFSLILVLAFLLNKKINKKDKIIACLITGIYVIASFIEPLYMFFHCFDTPDSYNFRYSYLIIFMLLCMAGFGLRNIESINIKTIVAWTSISVIIFVLYSVIQVRLYNYIIGLDPKVLLVNIIFAVIYGFVIYRYVRNDAKKILFQKILLSLVFVELCVNGLFYGSINQKVKSEETKVYFFYNNQIENVVKKLNEDDKGWYRVYSPNSLYCNDSMKYFYRTIGVFSSYQNQNLRKTLGRLGYVSSALTHRDMGSTEITRMLMGEKYTIVSSTWNKRLDEAHYELNDCWLPIGYMVSDGICNVTLTDDKNPFANQNKLLSAMIGEEVEYYTNSGENIKIDYYNAHQVETDDYPYFALDNAAESGFVVFYDETNKTDYAYFTTPFVMEAGDSPIVTNSEMETGPLIMDSFLLSPHIVETAEDDSEIYIVMGGTRQSWATFEKAYFYSSNEEQLQHIYGELSDDILEVADYGDGYIKGNINKDTQDEILFLSIPYQEGWKAYVDGIETKVIPLVDDAFIGVDIPEGEHEVVLRYYDNNITTGLVMMLFGILLAGCVAAVETKYVERKSIVGQDLGGK